MVTIVLMIIGKSARTAVLLSAFVPGGGQFYTENYFKGFIFSGAQGYLIYLTYKNYREYDRAKIDFANGMIEEGELNFKRSVFYDNLWWDGLVWFLSVVDAYIDAKLYEFHNLAEVEFSKVSRETF